MFNCILIMMRDSSSIRADRDLRHVSHYFQTHLVAWGKTGFARREKGQAGKHEPSLFFFAVRLRWTVSCASLPDGLVDVLQAFGVREGKNGVTIAAGICTQRDGSEETDLAFRLENQTHFITPTRQLFPGNVKQSIYVDLHS